MKKCRFPIFFGSVDSIVIGREFFQRINNNLQPSLTGILSDSMLPRDTSQYKLERSLEVTRLVSVADSKVVNFGGRVIT